MEVEKKYIFQCFLCKKFGKEESSMRVFEKQVMYDKIKPEEPEREGEAVVCKKCYQNLK